MGEEFSRCVCGGVDSCSLHLKSHMKELVCWVGVFEGDLAKLSRERER